MSTDQKPKIPPIPEVYRPMRLPFSLVLGMLFVAGFTVATAWCLWVWIITTHWQSWIYFLGGVVSLIGGVVIWRLTHNVRWDYYERNIRGYARWVSGWRAGQDTRMVFSDIIQYLPRGCAPSISPECGGETWLIEEPLGGWFYRFGQSRLFDHAGERVTNHYWRVAKHNDRVPYNCVRTAGAQGTWWRNANPFDLLNWHWSSWEDVLFFLEEASAQQAQDLHWAKEHEASLHIELRTANELLGQARTATSDRDTIIVAAYEMLLQTPRAKYWLDVNRVLVHVRRCMLAFLDEKHPKYKLFHDDLPEPRHGRAGGRSHSPATAGAEQPS